MADRSCIVGETFPGSAHVAAPLRVAIPSYESLRHCGVCDIRDEGRGVSRGSSLAKLSEQASTPICSAGNSLSPAQSLARDCERSKRVRARVFLLDRRRARRPCAVKRPQPDCRIAATVGES